MSDHFKNLLIALPIVCMTCVTAVADATPVKTPVKIDFTINSDGADRIRLVSHLRTLSQQVSAAACTVSSGIAADDAHDILSASSSAFVRYVHALRYGDDTLYILDPEENQIILRDLADITRVWNKIDGAITAVLENPADLANVHVIQDHNLVLLDLTTKLSTDIVARYAHPYEIQKADAFTIDVAGRQLMLTQKMAELSCEIWTGYHVGNPRDDLAKTMDMFENSLHALRFGKPELGIRSAPTDAIRDTLDDVLARWDQVKGNQNILLEGGTLDRDQKAEIFHGLQFELAHLQGLVKKYKQHAERHH